MATVPTAETSALPASLSHLLTEAQWSELKASGRRRLRLAAAEVEAATADEPARARALQRLQSMVDGALSAAQLRPKSTPGAAVLRAAKPASELSLAAKPVPSCTACDARSMASGRCCTAAACRMGLPGDDPRRGLVMPSYYWRCSCCSARVSYECSELFAIALERHCRGLASRYTPVGLACHHALLTRAWREPSGFFERDEAEGCLVSLFACGFCVNVVLRRSEARTPVLFAQLLTEHRLLRGACCYELAPPDRQTLGSYFVHVATFDPLLCTEGPVELWLIEVVLFWPLLDGRQSRRAFQSLRLSPRNVASVGGA